MFETGRTRNADLLGRMVVLRWPEEREGQSSDRLWGEEIGIARSKDYF